VVGAGHSVLQRKMADGNVQEFSLDRAPYIPFLAFVKGGAKLRRVAD
jgi:hypothetical protein